MKKLLVVMICLLSLQASALSTSNLSPIIQLLLLSEEPLNRTPVIASSLTAVSDATPILINIDFNQVVSGVTLADFQVTNGGIATLVNIDDQHYTILLTPLSEGVVSLSLPAGAAEYANGTLSLDSNLLQISFNLASVTVFLSQNFNDLEDGSPWPDPWRVAQGSPVVSHTIENGEACLEALIFTPGMPANGEQHMARMVTPGLDVGSFEVSFEVTFGDAQNQGFGFYGLQNDGFFRRGAVNGKGYNLFLRGFSGSARMEFWYEENGSEIRHHQFFLRDVIASGENQYSTSKYRVRYQVEYISAEIGTIQRAKIWLDGTDEPAVWQISDDIGLQFPAVNPMQIVDLQNIEDGFGIDLYNANHPAVGGAETTSICIDNVEITEIQQSAGPLEFTDNPVLVANEFNGADLGFLEGPVWREESQSLLFSDLGNDRILRLDPNNADALTEFRASMAQARSANGLANAADGSLLIAEQATQSIVSRTVAGVETSLTTNYLGTAYNSPNDLVSHTNGIVYFTDPTFGTLFINGLVQDLGFRGVFQRNINGVVELIGQFNQPNGIALSPDQTRLYVTETGANRVNVLAVDGGGNVGAVLAGESFSTDPAGGGGDGIKVDQQGNLYVAANNGLWVVAPDGGEWGLIALPQPIRNLAFGDADHKTLYFTLGDIGGSGSLYRMRVNIPGLVAPQSAP